MLYPYSESNATARLILHQLQFLENVVNPGDLAKNLLEVIESVQRTAQAELITSIPYILSHSDFNVKKGYKICCNTDNLTHALYISWQWTF